MLDAEFYTLLDHLLGDFGAGKNEHGIGAIGNRLQIRIAGIAFIGGDARIDGTNRVARGLEAAIAGVTARLALIRNADHGDLLLSEELLHERIDFSHDISFYA